MAESTSPDSSDRLIWRMISLDWYDDDERDGDADRGECTDGGDEEAHEDEDEDESDDDDDEEGESSIKFSDLAKSMTSASSASQFTDVGDSIDGPLTVPRSFFSGKF